MTSTYDHCIEIQAKYNYLIGATQSNESSSAFVEELYPLIEGGFDAFINARSKDKDPKVWVVCVVYTVNNNPQIKELEDFCKIFNIPFDL